MPRLFNCRTNGKGLWSRAKKTIPVLDIQVVITTWSQDTWGELKAYYPVTTWRNNKEGLIYTDPQWICDFRTGLLNNGFSLAAVDDVSYSEQGMQGLDYVSMDVGATFIKELDVFNQFVNGKEPVASIVSIVERFIEDD